MMTEEISIMTTMHEDRRVRSRARTRIILILGVAAAATGAGGGGARADCNQTNASQADIDLWNTHGCWQDFFLWQYQAYNMSQSDWGSRGWLDACNRNFEYPKHWNASYLVTYGLADSLSLAFHGTADYRATAEAVETQYHRPLKHVPTDDTSIFGSLTPDGDPDVLATSCLLYDGGVPGAILNGNPASRAGDFMHEGWHSWMAKHGWDNGSSGGHRAGPVGACTFSACDFFYFHGIGAFAFGDMWQDNGTGTRFHSPNQVQVEFLCEVSDQPQSWVPASVRQGAAADANQRAATRFINGPGYTCGSARPW
jgi:hypothetical protein